MGKTEKKPDLSPLWESYRESGRVEFRDQLIKANYRLVLENVNAIMAPWMAEFIDVADLESAGAIGLWKAVERFNPNHGVIFKTYADILIRGEIMEFLRSQNWIPRHTLDLIEDCKKAIAEMGKAGNFKPSVKELAEVLRASPRRVEWVMKHIKVGALTYFLRPGKGGEDGDPRMFSRNFSLIADPKSPDPVEETMEKEKFDDWFKPLPRANKDVMNLYYRDGLTLKKVGEALGMSESNASLIIKQSIEILRGVYIPQNAA
jgi:RNA polymerase sigma factor FliA